MVNPWVCYGKTLESGAKAKTTVQWNPNTEETIALHKPVKKLKPPFEQKNLTVVEALTTVENPVSDTREWFMFSTVKVIQKFCSNSRSFNTGVIVRAAHNQFRFWEERLWSKLAAQPISFEQEIELPQTQRPAPN